MKHLPAVAAVSFLAVSGWAATIPGPRPSPLAPPLAAAVQTAAACPKPGPAPAKPTWKHGQPEYNAFSAAAKATNNAEKAKLAADFAQKYPDSDYKNQALQLEMAAQAAVPSLQPEAVQTAEQLIKSPGVQQQQLLAAYVIISYLDPALVKPNDPSMPAKMAALQQAASCGQELLSSAPQQQQTQYAPILLKALGFAQLNQKNYVAAINTLTKVTRNNPKDALPYYWLGIAKVTQATPDFNAGIFDLARAAALSPQTAAFKSYLDTVYTSYHGASDGLQNVMATAGSNTEPPAGFKVMSKVDVENAQNMAAYQAALEKQRNTLPPENSFPGIEARLKRPDLAAAEWKKIKGTGYELDGIVTGVTKKYVDVAVGAKDASKNPVGNLRVELFAPLKKSPKVGEQVTVDGVAGSYQPNPPNANEPFMLILAKGSIKGFGFAAPGQSK